MEKKKMIESLLCDEVREESSTAEIDHNEATTSTNTTKTTNSDTSNSQVPKRKRIKSLHMTAKKTKSNSQAYKALEAVINDTRVVKDLRQLNLFCHTGNIEVFHSMMLKYLPTREEFQYPQMVTRTQLAALDHNFNLKRKQKEGADGSAQFVPVFPKATSRWCVKKRYEEKDYRNEMMVLVVSMKINDDNCIQITPHQLKKATLPNNIASISAPPKEELVEAHVSRFKIN